MNSELLSLSTLFIALGWLVFCAVILFLPPILFGIILETKAVLQGRTGASPFHALHSLNKILCRGESISAVAGWIFRSTYAINFAIVLIIAFVTPWISFKPALLVSSVHGSLVAPEGEPRGLDGGSGSGGVGAPSASNLPVKSVSINGMSIYAQADDRGDEGDVSHHLVSKVDEERAFLSHVTTSSDMFLVICMFSLVRLFSVLAPLDSGSAVGGLGASREVILALFAEPAIVLALASLGCAAHTSDLTAIFDWNNSDAVIASPALWFIAGVSLYIAAVIELSRMSVEDPPNRTELVMVREAMILENSGRNLALVEYTYFLKMTVLLGLTAQCFLHGIACFVDLNHWLRDLFGVLLIVLLAVSLGILESVADKMRWNKVSGLIAYSLAMSMLCAVVAIGVTR